MKFKVGDIVKVKSEADILIMKNVPLPFFQGMETACEKIFEIKRLVHSDTRPRWYYDIGHCEAFVYDGEWLELIETKASKILYEK